MNKDKYFHYLIRLVDFNGLDPYLPVLEHLHDTIFSEESAKLIPNDDNRITDGLMLRKRYCERYRINENERIFEEPCSLLEMMIGLADKINNQFGIKSRRDWFWEMMANIRLDTFDDRDYIDTRHNPDVDDIIDIFLQRDYDYHGKGGLFPLQYPERDQRSIEIWRQANAYLDEKY